MSLHDPFADEIEIRIQATDATMGLPEGERQILLVSGYTLISSNFQSQGQPVDNRSEIVVSGHPSPSSDVTSALLRFVEGRAPSAPQYNGLAKRITLSFPLDRIHIVLSQLSHANRYVWIGKFATQVYGDVHSHN